jgi:hypothetical protein
MTELSHLNASFGADSHRATKFTPVNIRQIINLVERGKNREEIAEIIGVTPGSLAVTCSKLGISLRRPFFGPGRQVGRPRSQNGKNGDRPTGRQETKTLHNQRQQSDVIVEKPMMDKDGFSVAQEPPGLKRQPCAALDIVMKYKGEARTTQLPLTKDIIGRLAVEAEFRSVKMADLVAQLIVAITERDLFHRVLDGSS